MVRISVITILILFIVSCSNENKQKMNQVIIEDLKDDSTVNNVPVHSKEALMFEGNVLFEILNKFSFIQIKNINDTIRFNNFNLISISGINPDKTKYKYYTIPHNSIYKALRDSLYLFPEFDSNFSLAIIKFGDCSLDMSDTSIVKPLSDVTFIDCFSGIEETLKFNVGIFNFKGYTIKLRFEQVKKEDAFCSDSFQISSMRVEKN